MQKLSHDDLTYLLEFFAKGRQEIVAPFAMEEAEWANLTYKYERNPEAFTIVRAMHFIGWLDSQFEKLGTIDVSDQAKEKAIKLLASLIDTNESDIDSSLLKHHLIFSKLQVFKEFLKFEDKTTAEKIKLLARYHKEKALFEREFEKYEEEQKAKPLD